MIFQNKLISTDFYFFIKSKKIINFITKAGVKCVFTYTKRELSLLALCLTLFILLIYNLVLFPIINSIFNPNVTKIYSNYVYSKTIPINQINNNLQSKNHVCMCNTASFQQNNEHVLKLIQKQDEDKNSTQTKQENSETTKQDETKIEKVEQQTSKKQNQLDIIETYKNIEWRIEIPKINLDVHIMEGTTSSVLLKAVGHFEETSKWNGNVGLAAHNRGYQCNFFAKIKNLQIGDEIIYKTTNGKKVYKIQTNKVIQDTDWSYLKETEDNRITLITCEENRPSYRRCIQAVEIATYKI